MELVWNIRIPNITPEFIEAHTNDKRWKCDWYGISMNPYITQEFIETHLNDERWKWDWYGISMNPYITPKFIEAHHSENWDWEGISLNKFGWRDPRDQILIKPARS